MTIPISSSRTLGQQARDAVRRRLTVAVSDLRLRESVHRCAAAATTEPVDITGTDHLRMRWRHDDVIVLDAQRARDCVAANYPRRDGVLLVGDEFGTEAWSDALRLGAHCVVRLPAEQAQLTESIAEAMHRRADTDSPVIAIIGASGGVGASTLAATTALACAQRLQRAFLLDLDTTGAGVDFLLGVERDQGLRWPQIRLSDGRVSTDDLCAAVPTVGDERSRVALLCADDDGAAPDAETVDAVVDAAARDGVALVADLPRGAAQDATPAVSAVLARAQLVVVMVSAQIRSCASGRVLVRHLDKLGVQPQVIVRGPAPGGLRPCDAAEQIGAPLFAALRSERALPVAIENGRLAPRRRGPLAVVARRLAERGAGDEATAMGSAPLAATGDLAGDVAAKYGQS